MIEIPINLRLKELRFCILKRNDKESIKDHNTINYQFDDPILQKYLSLNYNYGVLSGYNNLIIIDYDDSELINLLEINKIELPETFTLLSAGKKLPHRYYFTDLPFKTKIFPEGKRRIIEFRSKGLYCVGPNSIIDNNKYEIILDIPITKISNQILSDYIQKIEDLLLDKDLEKISTRSSSEFQGNSFFLKKSDYEGKTLKININDSWIESGKARTIFQAETILVETSENLGIKRYDFIPYYQNRIITLLSKGKRDINIISKLEKDVGNGRSGYRWFVLD